MYVYISVAPVTVIFAVNGLRVTKVGNEGELLQGSSKGQGDAPPCHGIAQHFAA